MSKNKTNLGRPKDLKKRESILSAAAAIFMESGLNALHMEHVAKRAGVSKATLYNHFKTKELIFEHLIAQKTEEFIEVDFASQIDVSDPVKALNFVGHNYLGIIYSPEASAMRRSIIGADEATKPLIQPYMRSGPQKIFGELMSLLARLEKESSFHFSDRSNACDLFLTMLRNQKYLNEIFGFEGAPTQEEREAIVDRAVDVFIRYYGPIA